MGKMKVEPMDRFEKNKMKGIIIPMIIRSDLFQQSLECSQNSKMSLNPFRIFGNVTDERVFMRILNFTQISKPNSSYCINLILKRLKPLLLFKYFHAVCRYEA